MAITSFNLESKDVYRTIFLNLEILYFEIECKARNDRKPLTRKKEKKIDTDESLTKLVSEFFLARININADMLPWPSFDVTTGYILNAIPTTAGTAIVGTVIKTTATADVSLDNTIATTSDSENIVASATASSILSNLPNQIPPSAEASETAIHKERMCIFYKLSSDIFENIEMKPSDDLIELISSLPNIKLSFSAFADIPLPLPLSSLQQSTSTNEINGKKPNTKMTANPNETNEISASSSTTDSKSKKVAQVTSVVIIVKDTTTKEQYTAFIKNDAATIKKTKPVHITSSSTQSRIGGSSTENKCNANSKKVVPAT